MYKRLVQIETTRIFPQNGRGRPRKLNFDEAFDNILELVKTGTQWRHLHPQRCAHALNARCNASRQQMWTTCVSDCVRVANSFATTPRGASSSSEMGSSVAQYQGSPSMPKKKLLKRLAVRTPTILLDKFRTSCRCPCGTSELKDASQSSDGRCDATMPHDP